MTIEVLAVLSRVIFTSSDANFTVAEMVDTKSARRMRITGKVIFAAKNPPEQVYRLFGEWQNNAKYGDTFVVGYIEPVRPDSLNEIVPFLAHHVSGVGKATATKLVKALNVKTLEELLDICANSPEQITQFFKSRTQVSNGVIALLTGNEVYRSIMLFLHKHEIPPNFAQKIYEKYQSNSIQLLTENPYRLINDFRSVGFIKADAIAQKLGVSPTSQFRIEAAFSYALRRAEDDGNCCLPLDALVCECSDILGGRNDESFNYAYVLQQLRAVYKKFNELDSQIFLIRQLTEKDLPNTIKNKESFFYIPNTFVTENKVAMHCMDLIMAQNAAIARNEFAYYTNIEEMQKLAPEIPWEKLSDEQFEAVKNSVQNRFMVLTGGPGCGKTFVLRAIFAIQCALKRKVALCAPTGLAAKRMTASIGAPASTIHKLLRIGKLDDLSTSEADSDTLENIDVIIVDEASMLSLDLFSLLLDSINTNKRLFLVGDADQLPSVGAGNCLRDIISSNVVPVTRLTKIFRQSSQSPIPVVARQVLSGVNPGIATCNFPDMPLLKNNMQFIPAGVSDFIPKLISLVRDEIPSVFSCDPSRFLQVLVPLRRGDVGQDTINNALQMALNPKHPNKKEVALPRGGILRVGDKVIQTKNNYEKEVFNGDLGFCCSIDSSTDGNVIVIEFDDRKVSFAEDEIEDLQLSYAMTVHKSQGSEFKIVIIPMFSQYYVMLDRNLLYTALTRASETVIFIGDERALRRAVKTVSSVKRYTALEGLLRASCAARIMTPV